MDPRCMPKFLVTGKGVVEWAYSSRELDTLIPAEVVRGLASGLVATAGMSLIEFPIWRKWGMEGVVEWHMNQSLMARLLGRPPEHLVSQGLILHFLHGGLAGIVFVLMLPIVPRIPIISAGVAFGLILWVISLLIMRPVTGVGLGGHHLRWLTLVVALAGHLFYGILLAFLVISL
jgi:hypothetical protein